MVLVKQEVRSRDFTQFEPIESELDKPNYVCTPDQRHVTSRHVMSRRVVYPGIGY